eukprot:scaffold107265_cov21-Tisochrysis_lutea.AAC.3
MSLASPQNSSPRHTSPQSSLMQKKRVKVQLRIMPTRPSTPFGRICKGEQGRQCKQGNKVRKSGFRIIPTRLSTSCCRICEGRKASQQGKDVRKEGW